MIFGARITAMGRMQQRKGKAFEKLVANIIGSSLNEWLLRNPNQTGEDAGRDLLSRLPFCIQCSHGKRVDAWKKLKEAKASAREGELAVAVLRKDYQPIIVTMTLADWLELVKVGLHNG